MIRIAISQAAFDAIAATYAAWQFYFSKPARTWSIAAQADVLPSTLTEPSKFSTPRANSMRTCAGSLMPSPLASP